MATVAEVLSRIDYLLLQNGVAEGVRRWSQTELFLWVRDAQDALIKAKPESSAAVVTITYVNGARQALGNSYYMLIRLHGLTMFDRATLDAFEPGWEDDDIGTPEEYSYDPSLDRTGFYVNPPATSGLTVTATVSKAAVAISATSDSLVVHDEWLNAIALYTAHLGMSKQSDYAQQGIAASFLAQFQASLGQPE